MTLTQNMEKKYNISTAMLANVPTFSFPVACVACCDCSVIAVERNEMRAATFPESRKHGDCL